ncbi:hypothetical protein SISNIDRAFT_420795, partial [Sistotremastrum niveocremeum HHB9708]
MQKEIKLMGEKVQRHECGTVCEKYGNIGKCRFQYPHDIELVSRYDADTKSVIFRCLDGDVNYFNPYMLVFCRHNHDIKCILSGRSAKAAQFYITDYITKTELKTHDILSLL